MHLLSMILIADGALCVAGASSMAYWAWKAEASPEPCEECGLVHDYRLLPPNPPLPAVESWRYWLLKRVFDIVCSLLMIAVFSVPAILIGILIALTSEGPIFYREERIGRYGYPFRIWKFRTMQHNANAKSRVQGMSDDEANPVHWRMIKSADDPRITRLGRVLRKWSFDEIPQLLNILLGHMSLVGPRPIVEGEVRLYGDFIDEYLKVMPGLSGLWQVSGRSNIGYSQRARLDAHYVKEWMLKNDLSILARTVPVVIKRIGAK